MKKILIIGVVLLFLLPLVNSLGAEEVVIGNIQPNILDPNRLDVVSSKDNKVHYYLKRDILWPERWNIYHTDSGHKAGSIERNPVNLYQSDIKMKAPTGVYMKVPKSSYQFRRFKR